MNHPAPQRIATALNRRARRLERVGRRHLTAVGDRVSCPVCGWSGVSFGPSYNPRRPNRICPGCLSNERYRALNQWLDERGRVDGARLLEVAPIELVRPQVTGLGYRYHSVDLHSARAETLGDLCALPYRDDSFDVIVCFHVLEHVPDDAAAMRELRRITSPDGVCIVVVPWDIGREDTFEDPDARPEDYERLYGQSDHVRIYGTDVTPRLLAAGFAVDEALWTETFDRATSDRIVLEGDDDRFWLCRPMVTE